MTTSGNNFHQKGTKPRLTRRFIAVFSICVALVVLFGPKKLSWLCSIEDLAVYEYRIDMGEFQRGEDVQAFQARAEDTWVIWTGWTRYIPGDALMVNLFSEQALAGQIFGLYGEASGSKSFLYDMLNNGQTIYLPWFGSVLSRYQSLNHTLAELLSPLE